MPLTGAVAPSRSMRTALARSMCNYARFHGSNSSLLAQQAVAPQRQGLQRSHHRTIWNLAKGFGLGFAGKPTETL